MVWTAPMTATAGAFTAANFNLHIRDNLNVQSPALATVIGSHFVSTAANTLVKRKNASAYVATSNTMTASGSYADLAIPGPTYTVTTGTKAIVGISAFTGNSAAGVTNRQWMSIAVSGATTTAASDTWALMMTQNAASNYQCASVWTLMTLNAGANTFTAQYRVSAGTGTFYSRGLVVIPL